MSSRVWSVVWLVVTAVAVGGTGWLGWDLGRVPPRPDRPNVLLVTLDTTRADHIETFGYFRHTMPHLAHLAHWSWVFDDAWAPMATTLPSHTTLLTGAWPLEHGVLANIEHGGRRTLPSDGLPSVAELFRRAGYRTAAFVSATPLAPGSGIERGFEVFDLSPDKPVRKAHGTTDAALGWLRKNGPVDDDVRRHGRPFFLWVHYYDPHGPYAPPEDFDRYHANARMHRWLDARGIPATAMKNGGEEIDPVVANDRYDGELRYVDTELNRVFTVLERRGWADSTVVVVVGDHGEGLGQHDVVGHGQVWREQVQVPLLVYVPWEQGERVSEPVSMVDVMPTVLGWVDLPGEKRWLANTSGRDVLARASGPALALTSLRQENLVGTPAQLALTAGDWRYLESGGVPHVFDLRVDPHERGDRSAALPFHRAVLGRWTHEVRAAQAARGEELGTGEVVTVPESERAALMELGYVE